MLGNGIWMVSTSTVSLLGNLTVGLVKKQTRSWSCIPLVHASFPLQIGARCHV